MKQVRRAHFLVVCIVAIASLAWPFSTHASFFEGLQSFSEWAFCKVLNKFCEKATEPTVLTNTYTIEPIKETKDVPVQAITATYATTVVERIVVEDRYYPTEVIEKYFTYNSGTITEDDLEDVFTRAKEFTNKSFNRHYDNSEHYSSLTNFLDSPVASGDILYVDDEGTFVTMSIGSAGSVLQSSGSGIQWVATSTLGLGGGGGGSGTVTSVDMSVPVGFSISGNPIIDAGTLAFDFDTGYEALLTASSTNWNDFYDTPSSIIAAGTGLSWTGNTLNAIGGTSSSPFGTSGGIITKNTDSDLVMFSYGNTLLTSDAVTIDTASETGITETGVSALSINAVFGDGIANTNAALSIAVDSAPPSGDETFYALNIDGLSSDTLAQETAINIGSNWETVLASENFWIYGDGGIENGGFNVDSLGNIYGIWIGDLIAPDYGGTGINTSLSTGIPVINSGTWSVSPSLDISNGGTGTTTQFTAGSIIFSTSSGVYAQDNSNLFWDGANKRLGLGTTTPSAKLSIFGSGSENIFSFASSTGSNLLSLDARGVLTFGTTTEADIFINGGESSTNTQQNKNNIGIGNSTLTYVSKSAFLGGNNIALGYEALYGSLVDPVTGNDNLAFGYQALSNNTSGSYNTALGNQALNANTIGSYNVAIGSSVLVANTSGSYNVASGENVLGNNTTGSENIANGYTVMNTNTTGSNNIANGSYALTNNISGSYNIALGRETLYNYNGTSSVALGYRAGKSFTSGNSVTFLGAYTDAGTGVDVSNSTAIGTGAFLRRANTMVLGGTGANSVDIVTGTSTPWAKFSIQNNYGSTTPLFDIATTTSSAFATSSLFRVNHDGKVGIGTSTPTTALTVVGTTTLSGLNIVATATTTSNVGFNITSGCYAINGVCTTDTVVRLTGITVMSSTADWTKPSQFSYAVVEVWGGGGGGSGNNLGVAYGGGGGGYTQKTLTASDLSATTSIRGTVGAAGTAGISSCGTGGTGGTSNFGHMATSTGGTGGGCSVTSSGGSGSGGSVNLTGGSGDFASAPTGNPGGAGGDSPRGGGIGGSGSENAVGNPGTGFGGGGGAGGTAGTPRAGGAGAAGGVVIYEYTTVTSGSDLAENYPTMDATLSPGDIVAFDSTHPGFVTRAQKGDRRPLAGIISTAPGVVLGEKEAIGERPVALSGRIPTKVNLEGGPITVGDRITLSSVAGVGKKAGIFDESVGIAIGAYDGSESEGTVMVFMNLERGIDISALGGALLASSITDAGGFNFVASLMAAIGFQSTTTAFLGALDTSTTTPTDNPTESLWSRLVALASNFMDGVLTLVGLKADEVETDLLCIGETCVDEDTLKALLNESGQAPVTDMSGTTTSGATGSDTGGAGDTGTTTDSGTTGDSSGEGTGGTGGVEVPPVEETPPAEEPPAETPPPEEPPIEEPTSTEFTL